MDIFGNNPNNVFDQSLNTTDAVEFTRVDVTDNIVDNSQLATKLYVDAHSGGGGGNMSYVGTVPANYYIYKASTTDGLSLVKSNIVDTGGAVIVNSNLFCTSLDGQTPAGNLNIGAVQNTVTIPATNGIISNKFVKSGGTNIQYLMGDGSTLTQSANSGNSNFYLYQSINGVTTPPLSSGNIGYNNAVQASATIVYINHLTRDNIDVEVFFSQVNQLNDLYIQDQNNSVNFIKYNITALPTIIANSYVAIPVLYTTSGGTGNSSFGASHNVLVAFFSNLTEVDTRLSTLESDTQNQTAILGTTTFTGGINCSASISASAMYALNFDNLGSVAVGLGVNTNNVTYIGNGANPCLVNSSYLRANSFVKQGGLATEFLKADGTVDSVQGMPFNSIYGNTTTAPTGTRALWYTAITPYATTINGIQMYVDGGGSDTTHFAIYRGYLKAGVGTNPGLNMALVGQSAPSLILTTGLPFNRVPITVVAGQSLAFTAGSYLTIAFHTSGTLNTFLSSPTGFSSVGLCYTTTSNYANTASFPATMNNVSINVVSTQRICFDLY